MSDKIYRTVTFEIEPSGDCDNCKSRKDSRCLVFDEFIFVHKYKNGNAVMGMVLMVTENKQCQACREYLEAEKVKVNNKLIFENVSSNILCSGNGERKLLDLTLPITPGNEVQCNTAYCKSGKLRVIVEWE